MPRLPTPRGQAAELNPIHRTSAGDLLDATVPVRPAGRLGYQLAQALANGDHAGAIAALGAAIPMMIPGGAEENAAAHAIPAAADKFAILTAANAGGQTMTPIENAARNAALESELTTAGHKFTPVIGNYLDDQSGQLLRENSYMIPNMSADQAKALGKKYGQNSVITEQGLHSLADGSLYPSRGVNATTELPYTELPDGQRFALDLDWSNPVKASSDAPVNAAPSIITKPNTGDVFDVSRLGTNVPAGVGLERPTVKYPTDRTDVSALSGIGRRFREVYTPNAQKALQDNPAAAGWYDMSQVRDAMGDLSPQGVEDFKKFMLFMGPTSSGNKVPMNVRHASQFFQLWKNGQLDVDALKNGALNLPPGYANRRQASVNSGIARILETGNLDPINQPKTYRYANQLAGDAWGGAALDLHVGRQVGPRGLLDDGETVTPARGFPQPSYARDQAVSSSPVNTHYPIVEDALIRQANNLGLAPAQYQALGWVGGGAQTGVSDNRPLLAILNDRLRATASKYGYPSALDAFRAFAKGQTPLWAMLPAAAIGGAAAAGSQEPPRRN